MSATGPVRLGTRGSALALAQAQIVARALELQGIDHQVVVMETAGDRRAPDTAWGEGAFVAAIERALLEGTVDLAVHSAKDVPTDEDPRLRIAAYLARGEPLDALVVATSTTDEQVNSVDDLWPGAVIGTDSPRRTGFLRALRPDVDVRPLHGNVDTRLRRLDDGYVDALVLAAAGLIRLGRAERITARLSAEMIPPAPGQGAICVQARAEDVATLELLAAIDDSPTRRAVESERALLRATGGGCRAPVGALASVDGEQFSIVAGFATLDGRATGIDHLDGAADASVQLAEELGRRLVDRRATVAGRRRVLVTRPADGAQRLVARLAEHGIGGVVVPAIEIEMEADSGVLDDLFATPSAVDLAVVTSVNGARAVRRAAEGGGHSLASVRWAAVGSVTARELRAGGALEVWTPSAANVAQLAEELPVQPASRVWMIRGSLAEAELPDRLRERGADVREAIVYRTIEAPTSSHSLLAEALDGGRLRAVIHASPSAIRGLTQVAERIGRRADVDRLPVICIGPTTAAAAHQAGLTVLGESATQAAEGLAELAAGLLAGQE